jgi:hypothetical protein
MQWKRYHILTSIKASGAKPLNFLIEMVTFHKYDVPRKIIAMSGLETAVLPSVNIEGNGRIRRNLKGHLRNHIDDTNTVIY